MNPVTLRRRERELRTCHSEIVGDMEHPASVQPAGEVSTNFERGCLVMARLIKEKPTAAMLLVQVGLQFCRIDSQYPEAERKTEYARFLTTLPPEDIEIVREVYRQAYPESIAQLFPEVSQ